MRFLSELPRRRSTDRSHLPSYMTRPRSKKSSRFSKFRKYWPRKMSLMKSVLSKLSGFRFGFGGGDEWNPNDCDDRWNSIGHPSRDPFGNPQNAQEYYYRRRRGYVHRPCCSVAPVAELSEPEEEEFMDENQAPVFIPCDIQDKIPTPGRCRLYFPPEMHRFIVKNSKKDCRSWLWKNKIGSQVRLQIRHWEEQQQRNYQAHKDRIRKSSSKFTLPGGAVREPLVELQIPELPELSLPFKY